MPIPSSWKDKILKVPPAGWAVRKLEAAGHPREESETGGLAVGIASLAVCISVFNTFLLGVIRAFFGGIFESMRLHPEQAVIFILLTTMLVLGIWFRAMGRRAARTRAEEFKAFRERERLNSLLAQVERGAMGHFKEAFEAVLKAARPDLAVQSVHVTDANPRIRFHARKRSAETGGDKSYLQFKERLFDDTRDVLATAFRVAPNAPAVTVDALLNFINRKAQFVDAPVLSLRARREVFRTLDTTLPDSLRFLSPLEIRYNDGSEVEPHPEMESRHHRVVERLKKELPKLDIRYDRPPVLEADDWRAAADPEENFITELSGRSDPEGLPLAAFETVLVKTLRRHGFDVPKARTVPGPGLEFQAYHSHPLLGGAFLVCARQVSPTLRTPVETVEDLDRRVREEGRQRGIYFVTGPFTEEAVFRARALRVTLVDRLKFMDTIRWDADPAMKVDAYGATVRKPLDPSVDLSSMPVPSLMAQMEALLGNLGFKVDRLARLQAGSVKAVAVHNHPLLGGTQAVCARQFPVNKPADEEVVREFIRIMEAEFCTRGFLFLSTYLTPEARKLARASGVDPVERSEWMNLLQIFKGPA